MSLYGVPEPIRFVVYGVAAPAGSKRHVGGARVIDASKRSAPWKEQVANAAADAMSPHWKPGGGLLEGPLSVSMTFYIVRPQGHYSTRARKLHDLSTRPLLPSAPAHPTTRPDVLKLARAVEDACTGIIWRDDAQIVSEWIAKAYGEPARVQIIVSPVLYRPKEATR